MRVATCEDRVDAAERFGSGLDFAAVDGEVEAGTPFEEGGADAAADGFDYFACEAG